MSRDSTQVSTVHTAQTIYSTLARTTSPLSRSWGGERFVYFLVRQGLLVLPRKERTEGFTRHSVTHGLCKTDLLG